MARPGRTERSRTARTRQRTNPQDGDRADPAGAGQRSPKRLKTGSTRVRSLLAPPAARASQGGQKGLGTMAQKHERQGGRRSKFERTAAKRKLKAPQSDYLPQGSNDQHLSESLKVLPARSQRKLERSWPTACQATINHRTKRKLEAPSLIAVGPSESLRPQSPKGATINHRTKRKLEAPSLIVIGPSESLRSQVGEPFTGPSECLSTVKVHV